MDPPIVFRAAVKPTPSIAQLQHTVNADGEAVDINIRGRHESGRCTKSSRCGRSYGSYHHS